MEADRYFNQARAEGWIKRVEHELTLVKETLDATVKEMATSPEEDDTIMTGLREASKKLEQVWNTVIEFFQALLKGITEITEEFVKSIQTGLKVIDEFLQSIHT